MILLAFDEVFGEIEFVMILGAGEIDFPWIFNLLCGDFFGDGSNSFWRIWELADGLLEIVDPFMACDGAAGLGWCSEKNNNRCAN